MAPAVDPVALAARFNDIHLALTPVGRGLRSGEMEFDDVLAADPAAVIDACVAFDVLLQEPGHA